MTVQCIPTDWHNQIDIVMVIGGARPVPQVDIAPGRGQWLRDLSPRRPVERAPRRSPAGHPEHTAAGGDSADGIIRSIARTSAVRTNIQGDFFTGQKVNSNCDTNKHIEHINKYVILITTLGHLR